MTKNFKLTLKNIPKNVIRIDEDVCEVIVALHCYFSDNKKTMRWLNTKNLNVGGIKPMELIQVGRAKKLAQIINNMIDGNMP